MAAAGPQAQERVLVWVGADRTWRYRYVDPGKRVVIQSNRGFLTRDEAVASARVAYPDVPVVHLSSPPRGEPARRSWWTRAAIRLSALGVLAWLVRAVLRMVLRMRRSARKAKKLAGWVTLALAVVGRRSTPDHRSR
jgi:hypothetical protein